MDDREPEKQTPSETSPLEVEQPKVARFSRRMIIVMFATAAAILAIALVSIVSPKKKAQGQESEAAKPREAGQQSSPGLPDTLATAPGNYSELPQGKSSAPHLLQKPGDPAPGNSGAAATQQAPAYTVHPPGTGQTPQEQTREQDKEQSQKDAASAINSPVTFSQGDPPQQTRQEEPRRVELEIPNVAVVPRVAERASGADDQNLQGEKREFAKERPPELPYLKATLLSPLSPYEIKAGTILPALLITGVNSDLPGQLVAQLRENVYDTVTGNHLLIPQGTRLIGEYDSKIAFGQERVLVVWTRLIMPNGDSVTLEGMPGTDLSGYAGMSGKVNNHYGKLVTGVVLGSVIGAGAQVAVGGQGAPNVPPSFGQMAVSGAAQNINQSAQQQTSKVLNMQPTIEVTPGDKINVFVTKDMILKPFTQ